MSVMVGLVFYANYGRCVDQLKNS